MVVPLLPLLITLPASAWPMIMVSFTIGIILVALQYMLSYAFSNPQMQAVAKEELAALIFSAFIILFWVTSDATFNSASNGLLLSSIPEQFQSGVTSQLMLTSPSGWAISHIQIAIGSLDISYQKLKSAYVDLYLFEALIGFLSTVSFPIGSPIPAISIISFSLAPFTGLALLSNAHTIVVEALSYLITVVWAKQFILYFARDCVPLFMLPLGLVLRAFPFFRTTGSSLIALCFAIYFVFPFTVILSNYLTFEAYGQSFDSFSYSPPKSSFFSTAKGADEWKASIDQARHGQHVNSLMENFNTPDAAETASTSQNPECAGNSVVNYLCSGANILLGVGKTMVDFFKTVSSIWMFMVGFTGDFFVTLGTNPALPTSASAGLYHFIVEEVSVISPLVIIMTVTTVLEIIITVTMYRNISLLMGGEAEIIGLTKIV